MDELNQAQEAFDQASNGGIEKAEEVLSTAKARAREALDVYLAAQQVEVELNKEVAKGKVELETA